MTNNPFAHRAGTKEFIPIPVGLLTYVSNDNLPAFSEGDLPMTDFHQRQAISTLTAPAARGLTPHSLVQPGTRHALYPATGTMYSLFRQNKKGYGGHALQKGRTSP